MKKFSKFFVVFLCVVLLVFTVVRPVQVNASVAAATIAIGVYGGIKIVISAKVLVGLIITGFAGAIGSAFFSDIDEWYDSDPVIRDWADSNAHKVQEGARISIPSNVRTAIYARYMMYTPVAFDTLYVPYNLTHLENITSVDVFGVDVLNSSPDTNAILKENNSLLIDANVSLTSLFTAIQNMSLEIKSKLDAVSAGIKSLESKLVTWVGNVNASISTFGSSLQSWISNLNANVVHYGELQLEWLGDVNSTYKTMSLAIEDEILSLRSDLSTTVGTLQNTVSSLQEDQIASLSKINTSLKSVGNIISTSVDNSFTEVGSDLKISLNAINTGVQTWGTNIQTWTKNVNSNVVSYGQSNVDWLKNVNSNVVTGTKSVVSSLETVGAKIDTLIETIPTLVDDSLSVTKPEIGVQVGTQTLVVSDYATMGQAFSAKMAWVPQIFDFLSELRSRLNSGTPPKVAINLSAAEGSIDWGGSAYIMDMSWYARYKPSVDTVLSGIMWLCFGWAVYKRIPDIISGVGLTMENATQTPGHVWSDRAERSASFQYRADRRQDYYSRRG